MKAIIFDTETTGVPKNYKASIQDLENWPRVIQLAWELVDVQTTEIFRKTAVLIKPDGWEIPKEKFWLENGFSTELSNEQGQPMTDILTQFIEDLNKASFVVAHNYDFDHPILCAEMIRYGLKGETKYRQKICTMASTVNLCKIPFPGASKYGSKSRGFKWPKLEELYKHLFNRDFEGAHDAGADVAGCRECFFELIKRGVLILEAPNA